MDQTLNLQSIIYGPGLNTECSQETHQFLECWDCSHYLTDANREMYLL